MMRTASPALLRPLRPRQLSQLVHAIAIRAVRITAYEVTQLRSVRQGYGWEISAEWRWSSSVAFLTLNDAKNAVERQRQPGAWWRIREIPAVGFVSHSRSLVVAEPGEDAPLTRHRYDETCPPYLAQIARHFGQILVAGTRRTDFLMSSDPYLEWTSRARKPRLAWGRGTQSESDSDTAINRIMRAYERSLDLFGYVGMILSHDDPPRITHLDRGAPLARRVAVGDYLRNVELAAGQSGDRPPAEVHLARPGDVLTFTRWNRRIRYIVPSVRQALHGFGSGDSDRGHVTDDGDA